jgi:hypothetical protein
MERSLISSGLLSDRHALPACARDEGGLFFRGLLPTEDLWRVRADELAIAAK